jgi:hypothetical protein
MELRCPAGPAPGGGKAGPPTDVGKGIKGGTVPPIVPPGPMPGRGNSGAPLVDSSKAAKESGAPTSGVGGGGGGKGAFAPIFSLKTGGAGGGGVSAGGENSGGTAAGGFSECTWGAEGPGAPPPSGARLGRRRARSPCPPSGGRSTEGGAGRGGIPGKGTSGGSKSLGSGGSDGDADDEAGAESAAEGGAPAPGRFRRKGLTSGSSLMNRTNAGDFAALLKTKKRRTAKGAPS